MSVHAELPLGEVCTIIGGGTPRRGNAAYFGGSIPWATPTDVTALEGPLIDRTRETITQAGLRESSARLVPSGTVLMTSRATIGYTAIAAVPMATNQGFANLVCGDQLLPQYLAFWLRGQRSRLIQLAGGTTFKELPKSTLKKVRIPLPPLAEQRRTVDILNRAARIQALRRQAADRLREFVPALFVRMFGDPVENPMGWEVRPLADLVQEFRYGTSRKCFDTADSEDALPVLRIPNVLHGGVKWTNLKFITLLGDERKKLKLARGDILFVRTNGNPEYIGRCAVFSECRDAAYASYLIRARLKRSEPVDPEYVSAALALPTMRQILLRLTRTTAGNYNISIDLLGRVRIPLPPLTLQHRYTETVKAAGAVVRLEESRTRVAAALMASLVSELFQTSSSECGAHSA